MRGRRQRTGHGVCGGGRGGREIARQRKTMVCEGGMGGSMPVVRLSDWKWTSTIVGAGLCVFIRSSHPYYLAVHTCVCPSHPLLRLFTLDFPSYYPVMTHCKNRVLREEMYRCG